MTAEIRGKDDTKDMFLDEQKMNDISKALKVFFSQRNITMQQLKQFTSWLPETYLKVLKHNLYYTVNGKITKIASKYWIDHLIGLEQ